MSIILDIGRLFRFAWFMNALAQSSSKDFKANSLSTLLKLLVFVRFQKSMMPTCLTPTCIPNSSWMRFLFFCIRMFNLEDSRLGSRIEMRTGIGMNKVPYTINGIFSPAVFSLFSSLGLKFGSTLFHFLGSSSILSQLFGRARFNSMTNVRQVSFTARTKADGRHDGINGILFMFDSTSSSAMML